MLLKLNHSWCDPKHLHESNYCNRMVHLIWLLGAYVTRINASHGLSTAMWLVVRISFIKKFTIYVNIAQRFFKTTCSCWMNHVMLCTYLSALEVFSRRGAIQIHIYLYLPLPYTYKFPIYDFSNVHFPFVPFIVNFLVISNRDFEWPWMIWKHI